MQKQLRAIQKSATLGAMSLLLTSGFIQAGDYSKQRLEVESLGALTTAPVMHDAAGFESSKNLKAIYFDALDWMGKPTKVFAWLGMPENSDGKKVPAVVLVHGGGGSAFKTWVEKWNAKGYAAISIAVEGQTDKRVENAAKKKVWAHHDWSGPARSGIYSDSKASVALSDQWMYHAVADTILANSLIRSLPEVDAAKVGLMGISWGGVITSTVIGIDDRFAFAIPTYGCGDLSTAGNQYGTSLGDNETYKQVWDPILRLKKVKAPTLWFSWPEDKHFPMNNFAACYAVVNGPHMVSLIPKMGHGHGPPWSKPDSYAFADSIVNLGSPWCQQTASSQSGDVFSVAFTATKKLNKAVLVSTTDSGVTGLRNWIESPATLQNKGQSYTASATLPKASTAWFINVVSKQGLVVSSDYKEQK